MIIVTTLTTFFFSVHVQINRVSPVGVCLGLSIVVSNIFVDQISLSGLVFFFFFLKWSHICLHSWVEYSWRPENMRRSANSFVFSFHPVVSLFFFLPFQRQTTRSMQKEQSDAPIPD
jgi:hypothetical protein